MLYNALVVQTYGVFSEMHKMSGQQSWAKHCLIEHRNSQGPPADKAPASNAPAHPRREVTSRGASEGSKEGSLPLGCVSGSRGASLTPYMPPGSLSLHRSLG